MNAQLFCQWLYRSDARMVGCEGVLLIYSSLADDNELEIVRLVNTTIVCLSA